MLNQNCAHSRQNGFDIFTYSVMEKLNQYRFLNQDHRKENRKFQPDQMINDFKGEYRNIA